MIIYASFAVVIYTLKQWQTTFLSRRDQRRHANCKVVNSVYLDVTHVWTYIVIPTEFIPKIYEK